MKKINVPVGLVFGVLSTASVLNSNWLTAVITGLLGVGFLLSDVAYLSPSAARSPGPALPSWRRYGSMLLIGAAILLSIYEIGHSIGTRISQTTQPNKHRPR